MSEIVTKTKNPGRVPQGHKHVALNRKRKKTLNAQNSQPAEQDAEQVAEQHAKQPSHTTFYGGGALAILFVGLALYLYCEKKPTRCALDKTIKPNDAIFCMN